jgi:two-component system, OmpR family, response regulator QseB
VRLLLIEDDPMLGGSVEEGLRRHGYAVDWAIDGEVAETALSVQDYDLLLLDLGLPKRSGLEILQTLRRQANPVPVLIITARDSVGDRIDGLDAGADDYLIKPFDLGELAARVRALSRRGVGRSQPLLINGDLTLNPATHEVTYKGRPVALPLREFALLQILMDPPGRIFSIQQLEDRLYGWQEFVESNAVEVRIYNVRKKLGADVIVNVRGVGYMVPKAR